jgi:hypothetical protein
MMPECNLQIELSRTLSLNTTVPSRYGEYRRGRTVTLVSVLAVQSRSCAIACCGAVRDRDRHWLSNACLCVSQLFAQAKLHLLISAGGSQ